MNLETEPKTLRNPSPRLPRVDLYGPVHKGIRWALTTLLTRLGAADFTDGAGTARLLDDLDGVLYLVSSHIAHEDRHIHPAIERRAPDASARLAEEHRQHTREIDDLRVLIADLASARPGAALAVGRRLYLAYSRFVANALVHMLEEETITEPLLEALYPVEELEAINDAILASIGPDELLAFTRVMVPANPRDVRVALLSGAKSAMPAAPFEILLESFRTQLDPEDFRDLSARLGVSA
jgi:hypothetical protein